MVDINETESETTALDEIKKVRKKRESQDQKRAKILSLAVQRIPTADIARAVEMPKSTVLAIIEKFKPVFTELTNVKDYRSIKADLLSAAQLVALKSAMSPKKLEKASYLATLQGYEILNKAERLESNQSTDNVAHTVFGKITIGNK